MVKYKERDGYRCSWNHCRGDIDLSYLPGATLLNPNEMLRFCKEHDKRFGDLLAEAHEKVRASRPRLILAPTRPQILAQPLRRVEIRDS